jgi:tetratricopeptide (TPR) repeat protein
MGEKKRRLARQHVPQNNDDAPAARARNWLERGLQLHRGGKLAEALNAYQEAQKHAPEFVDALHYQGVALVALGHAAHGIHLMQRSVLRAAHNPLFHFNLGNALQEADPSASIRHLQTAATLNPAEIRFALAHATALRRQGRGTEAIAELERARALDPDRIETLRSLAELYYHANRLELARERFEHTLSLNPSLAKTCYIGFAHGDKGGPAAHAGTPESGSISSNARFCADLDLHVVDDFLPDPLAYRAQALSLPFRERHYTGQNYPGIQTDGYPCQPMMERIAAVLGRTIKFMSPDNGSYRLSFFDSLARTDIHVDNEAGDNFNYYVGVLYLNPPEQCRGGTTFWKHLPTGWERRPVDTEVHAAGYPGFKAFQERWLPNRQVTEFNKLKVQRQAWQSVLEVPMQQNRLILYRGHYFHSISEVFGTSREDGRLVQLFFFEVPDD